EEAVDDEVVAENAHAAIAGLAARSKSRVRRGTLSDGRKDVQFEGGFQCGRLLIGIEGFENSLGVGACGLGACWFGVCGRFVKSSDE
ncbi:MAG: hypothetical protein WA744_06480, partial [Candidatus Acidiferrales bacterium]